MKIINLMKCEFIKNYTLKKIVGVLLILLFVVIGVTEFQEYYYADGNPAVNELNHFKREYQNVLEYSSEDVHYQAYQEYILPKTIATNHPYNTAKNFAIPLKIIKTLLFPIVWIFSLLSKLINKIETKIAPHKAPLITEEELKTLIDVGNKEGTLEAKEKTMLNKIFEFSDLRVRDILKPRTLVASLSVDSSYEEVVEKFSTSGYSRLPVYQDSFDNILGILHFKEVMFSGTKAKSSFNLKKLLKKATYVPETISAISSSPIDNLTSLHFSLHSTSIFSFSSRRESRSAFSLSAF